MTILGSYHSWMGGRIYLNLLENMLNQSMAGSCLHEMAHAYLTGTTVLGTLQQVVQMEALLSEEPDRRYSSACETCAKMLTERTRFVQEVHANNLELLTLEERLGQEEMLRALFSRPKDYQDYYMELLPVHRSGRPIREKLKAVSQLCAYAMNIPLPPQATLDPLVLAAWLNDKANPTLRLREAVKEYEKCGVLPEQDLDVEALFKFAETASVYVTPYLKDAAADFDRLMAGLTWESATDLVNRQMREKVCLFDPAMLRPTRVSRLPEGEDRVLLVIKGARPLLDEKNFYLVQYGGEGYVSMEAEPAELDKRLFRCISSCILLSEYDQEREAPQEFCAGQSVLTVLIQTSAACRRWLQKERELGCIFVGELRACCGQTDVSILFFCRRGAPRRIFVFPTLHVIGHELLQAFGLEDCCRHIGDRDFLKLFSCMDNELRMLQYLQGLLELLLGRGWKQMVENKALGQLAFGVGRSVLDSGIQFLRADHYKILAALPEKETKGPLFTLMRFQGTRNTGDTFAEAKTHAPLLFSTKAEAEEFAARFAPEYTAVGIDEIYWPFFRAMMRERKQGVILVLDNKTLAGKLVDVDAVSAIWYH